MFNATLTVQDFEFFILIFTRITCFFVAAPFFSTSNVPYRAKVGLGFFSALLIYQYVVPHQELNYGTVIGFAVLVMQEAIAGLAVGMLTNFSQSILTFAGKIMDIEVGLSMVNIYDPTTRVSEGFSGMFYHYMVLLILMLSDMHHYLLKAFIESYQLIPTGHVLIDFDALYTNAVTYLLEYMVIGFRICLPVFAAMLLVNCILGIMAKIAPQMNMFAVGMQIKLVIGLSVMYVTVSLMSGASGFIYTEMKKLMVSATGVFY